MTGRDAVLLGVDIGTTNVKVVALRSEGDVVGVARRPMGVLRSGPGLSDFDIAGLDRDLPGAVREALSLAESRMGLRPEVAAIAIASIGESFVGLDAAGRRITGCPTWFDRRTRNRRADWGLSEEDWFDATGMVDDDIYTAYRLPFLRESEPALFERVVHWLMVADYVVYRLCGERVSNPSLAARSGLADRATGDWSQRILAHAGIEEASLPTLLPAAHRAGRLTAEAAEGLGLPPGVPVINAGHDHPCAGLACGLHRPGPIIDSTGTSEAIKTVVDRPLAFGEVGGGRYDCYPHVVPGRFLLSGHIPSAGGLIDWLLRLLSGPEPSPDTVARLWAMAAASAPGAGGVRISPFLEGTGAPSNERSRRAGIVQLGAGNGSGDLLRAGLEALAAWADVNIRLVERYAGTRPPEIVLTGGGARNLLANRIKAAMLDRPFVIPEVQEAAGAGAAVVAGIAEGLIDADAPPSPLEAAGLARVEPEPDWVAAYAVLRPALVDCLGLRETHHG
ncbi:FGGY-family carbohydrate kinase [Aureimonas sp. ME7]|uniref:FGGY-family carbohydrate kinase n=1 Tax=Aureimonas sp. ME7 TaxID=2744252 RepID=UPI0015F8C9F4|nr:FGGY-family carbohydrate kinase [Aureimonas sp. ME7]